MTVGATADEVSGAGSQPHAERNPAAVLLGAIPAAIAAIDLTGWWLGFEAWTRWIAPLPPMAPLTALSFALLGAGIASATRARAGSAAWRRATLALAVLALTIAGATIVAYAARSSVGPERIVLYSRVQNFDSMYLGRMSPQTAGALACLAVALVLMIVRAPRRRAAQALGIVAAMLALVALAGHIHGVVAFLGVTNIKGMSLPTAVGLLAVAAGVAALDSEFGVRWLLSRRGPAGRHARQLALAALVIPFGSALLLRGGEMLRWYDASFRSAAYVAVMVLLLSAVVWAATQSLFRAEQERERLAVERSARELAEAVAQNLREQIGERKRAEEALRRSEEALRESDRRKDEFLAVLSHELRNPLAPMRNALWLHDRATGGEQAERAKEVIRRQVEHLARIVDDLLDVTRVTRGKIHLRKERVDLVELVRCTIEDHKALFACRDIAVSQHVGDLPLWVEVDATRISQAIGNLLQNAAKFTDPGGHAEIGVAREPHGTALVRVRDNGMGIPPPLLGRIFEPFTQGDESLDRSRGGLGLGLSLVKGFVDLHGGSVEARSDGPGRGAEFLIRLPVAPERPALLGPVPRGAPMTRRRVLVIEDNVDAAETLRDVLLMWHHDVEVARDGLEGIEKARAFHPQVVLCDIGLPVMDGYGVAREIRADPALASAFLVALTGYALPEDQRRAADSGFDRHLGKPVPIERLEEVLATAPLM